MAMASDGTNPMRQQLTDLPKRVEFLEWPFRWFILVALSCAFGDVHAGSGQVRWR